MNRGIASAMTFFVGAFLVPFLAHYFPTVGNSVIIFISTTTLLVGIIMYFCDITSTKAEVKHNGDNNVNQQLTH